MRSVGFAAAVIVVLGTIVSAQTIPAEPPRVLTVSADGQSTVLADTAVVTFQISGTDETSVGTAFANAQNFSDRLRMILTQQKFTLDQAQLTAYSVQTLYLNGSMHPLTVTGYAVVTTARLEITDFSRIAPLINALGDLPVLRSVTFTAHNLAAAQQDAIRDGYRNARAQAETLAAAAGRTLGEFESGSENVYLGTSFPGPGGGGGFGGMMPGPTEGYGTRELNLTARVTAIYALAPAGPPG